MEEKAERKNTVYSVTNRIASRLIQMEETSSGKATLAELRKSIGKPLSETIGVWSTLYDQLPEEFLGQGEQLSKEEKSILHALQILALSEQGSKKSGMMAEEEEIDGEKVKNRWKNMGHTFRSLRMGENTTAVDRRFNALITASTFEEFIYHLRQMTKLMKAKTTAPIHYGKLAEDLYWFQRGEEERVRLAWAKAYYQRNKKGEENNEQ